MKQPDLGKKLTELRKNRGLTQEELVERCNISVRTIQRIETGEVMPRSYTIKTIVTALDYPFEEIFGTSNDETQSINHEHNEDTANADKVPITATTSTSTNTQRLRVALVFGFIYFILTFPEAFAEYYRFSTDLIVFGDTPYTLLKILIGISFIIFQLGYVHIGKLVDNYLIRIAATTHIVITAAICIYDVISVYLVHDRTFSIFTIAMLYGSIGLLYGYAIIKLRRVLGVIAFIAGALEILSACLFLTVVLIPLADVINMFAELLEVIIVFKVFDMLKEPVTGTVQRDRSSAAASLQR
ncbi:helix-turn-helix transcriptional regulator [Chryseolinea sp. T2]|uniref:helix-turn-helix domain-containing protein n=1 Tax=Chryseolinea sp. T2 TaxID=3129255 RepID=UPI003077EE95